MLDSITAFFSYFSINNSITDLWETHSKQVRTQERWHKANSIYFDYSIVHFILGIKFIYLIVVS